MLLSNWRQSQLRTWSFHTEMMVCLRTIILHAVHSSCLFFLLLSCCCSARHHEVCSGFTHDRERTTKTMSGSRNVSAHLAAGCRFEERADDGTWSSARTAARTHTQPQQWQVLHLRLAALLSDVVSSHATRQAWHIGGGLSEGSLADDVMLAHPQPCFWSRGCRLQPPEALSFFQRLHTNLYFHADFSPHTWNFFTTATHLFCPNTTGANSSS